MDQAHLWWDWLRDNQYWRLGQIVVTAAVAAVAARVLLVPFLHRLTKRTGTDLDDNALSVVWPAIFRTIILHSVRMAALSYMANPLIKSAVSKIAVTLIILIWAHVVTRVGELVWRKLSDNAERWTWIQPQTLPLTQFSFKVLVFGLVSYLVMSAWRIDLTSWLASAGVVGIAVGFAAKDTLANFIAGVFILADAPYQVGQYIVIDGTTRGVVTEIGMRSTRMLTRDNVEVTVPNAVIGNAKIINESSGPSPKLRVGVNVGVAYGSDIEQVREILLACTQDISQVRDHSEAVARFVAMGASSLDFVVLVWVKHPAMRGRVVDELNTKIYTELMAAGVEIPFPQQDLHLKSWPDQPPNFTSMPPATSYCQMPEPEMPSCKPPGPKYTPPPE